MRFVHCAVLFPFALAVVAGTPAAARSNKGEPVDLTADVHVRAAELVGEHVQLERPLYIDFGDAFWQAMTEGTPEAFRRMEQAQLAQREVKGDAARFAAIRDLLADESLTDVDLRRQLEMLQMLYLPYQMQGEARKRANEIETRCEEVFSTYRMDVAGEPRSMAYVETLMRTSSDGALLEEAWKQSKTVGVELLPLHRELVDLRNQTARELGYETYVDMALTAQGFDPAWLESFFAEVEQATNEPFRALKAEEIDPLLSERFGVPAGELMPWHYGNPYFQDVPPGLYELDLDALYARRDHEQVVEDAVDFFAGVGLPAEPILSRSDLYPREGKNPHAMAHKMDLERRDTAVLLMNLPLPPDSQTRMGTSTLLHELGHCVHYEAVDHSLPYLMLDVDSQITEAVAMLLERQVMTQGWLNGYLGVEEAEAERLAGESFRAMRAQELIFARWCLVIYHWEKDIYANPEQDWGDAWWKYKEQFQLLQRPDGWSNPDPLGKYHLATAMSTYYNNYAVGGFIAAQVADALAAHLDQDVRTADYRGRPEAGTWLAQRVLSPGSRLHWLELVRHATGEDLTTEAWKKQFVDR
jgi:peptidyl-dipeptidase A